MFVGVIQGGMEKKMKSTVLGFVLMLRVGILRILVVELTLTKEPRVSKRVATPWFRA